MRVVPLLLAVSGILSQAPAAYAAAQARPYLNIPAYALSRTSALVVAHNGRALLYNYDAGLSGAPFLDNVYKSFGISADSRYFLYLKAENGLPAFQLYCHDLSTGAEKRIADVAVHRAAWSPAAGLFAYLWLDASNQFHLSLHDLATGQTTEVAAGQLDLDLLEWSPDAAELLYLTVAPLSPDAYETHQYASSLHRYSVIRGTEEVAPNVEWAQFSAGRLVVASKAGVTRYSSVPNPGQGVIRNFLIHGGRIYASILENGKETVQRWNAATNSYENLTTGRLLQAAGAGVLVREFTPAGIDYKFISSQSGQAVGLAQFSTRRVDANLTSRSALANGPAPAAAGTDWKLPYHGLAEMVQGGTGYQSGACDGASCLITAHLQELSYALDFQQRPEDNHGNTHILATEAGTVAAIVNTVTCSSNQKCVSNWDSHSNPCNDFTGGAGNYVAIAHLDGSYSFYAHLKSGSVQVAPGQAVSQGTYLGDQGHSGAAATYNNYRVCGDHLHFSRQVAPTVWAQSIPTDFGEAPCLMGCTSIYSSANVEIAPPPSLTAVQPASGMTGTAVQVTLTGSNFLYGSTVAVSAPGITVSNVALVSSSQITATFAIAAGASAGAYDVTVTTASGAGNPQQFVVVTAVPVTIATQPAGLTVSADGGPACTSPCTFQWVSGSAHTIATTATQSGGAGVQHLWTGWSDGGALSHGIIVPAAPATYTAAFATQYFLTTQASPAAGGVITPASGWYNAGTPVVVNAAANPGYAFTVFTGGLTGAATPQNLTIAAPVTVTANFRPNSAGAAPWYGTGGTWSHRKTFTVDRTKVAGAANLTDFPLLVSVTDADLRTTGNGGGAGQASGGDILFTGSDGVTKLNHEVEFYNPATGQLVAWVRVPALSPAGDTVIYAYYGNPSAAAQQNAPAVWDVNFKGVWHLGAASGAAIADSTVNANHGSKVSASSPAPAPGQAGGGQVFNGGTDAVTIPDSNSLDAAASITISAWIRPVAWPTRFGDAVVNKEGNYALRSGENAAAHFDMLWWNTSGAIRNVRTTPPSTGAWHYVVAQANNGDAYRLYVDGVLVASAPSSWVRAPRNLATALMIGKSPGDDGFSGAIDEVRISTSVRSSDWIVTEYRNQNSPGTFFAVGAQEDPVVTVPATVTSSPSGLSLTVDGTPCTAPCAFQWVAGSSHTIAATATQSGGAGIQYVWSNWSDGGALSHTVTMPAAPVTYTANFTTQYFLTTQASPAAGGVVTPPSGWHDSGTVIVVSAAANAGYTFSAFTGALTGAATPRNLTLTGPLAVTANFTASGGVPWYGTGGTWTHRKVFTVDHTKVSGTANLVNFPLLVSIADVNLRTTANGGNVAQPNGEDILFTASDGLTKLNHEMEFFNPSAGQLVAWVQIPVLSPTSDTVIYAYYGNASAPAQQNPAAVWDSNFKGVWHLGATSGTAIADSTPNANNGNKVSVSSPAPGAGQMGGAQVFNGLADAISVPDNNSLDATTALTISAWIKPNAWATRFGNAVVNKEGNYAMRSGEDPAAHFDMMYWNTSKIIRNVRTTPPSTGTWHYVVGQLNNNDAYRLYVDGVLVASTPASWFPSSRNLTRPLMIGKSPDNGFDGAIDEVRISASIRSSDWILTEYRNQSSPATFVSAGPEE